MVARLSLTVGFTMGIFTCIWFLYGGFKDLANMFKTLKTSQRNAADNGSVRHDAADDAVPHKDAS